MTAVGMSTQIRLVVAAVLLAVAWPGLAGMVDSGCGLTLGVHNFALETDGVQLGLVNGEKLFQRQVRGLQAGVLANTAVVVRGGQIGLANDGDDVAGGQLGLYSKADEVSGVQLSLVNRTRELRGLQLGLLNVSEDRWFPLVNWGWRPTAPNAKVVELARERGKGLVVPLKQDGKCRLLTFEASVEGVPCRLLFDTGATYTLLDESFVTNSLPSALDGNERLRVSAPNTNVRAAIKMSSLHAIALDGFSLEDNVVEPGFGRLGLAVVPLPDRLLRGMDCGPVHGICGLSSLGGVPFVLSRERLVLCPSPEELDGFGPDIPNRGNERRPVVRAGGIDFVLDSGCSISQVSRGRWPETSTKVSASTHDINGTQPEGSVAVVLGERRHLDELGIDLAPDVRDEGHEMPNLIGAEILQDYDVCFDLARGVVRFRRR